MMLHRLVLSLFLTLMLGIGAVQAAASRLQAPVAGHLVICSGARMVTLYLDATGQPAAAPHICPDCTFAMAPGPGDAPVPLPQAPIRPQDWLAMAPGPAILSPAAPCPQARGPPVPA